MNNITEELTKEKAQLEAAIRDIENKVLNLNTDTVYIRQKNGRNTYYRQDGKKEKYIPKEKEEYAMECIIFSYYSELLRILKEQSAVIDRFLKHYAPDKKIAAYSKLSAARKTFIEPEFKSTQQIVSEWKASAGNYRSSDPYKNAQYRTMQGDYVRSKSELHIANMLFTGKIPYRYEDGLLFDDAPGRVFYPDFHIMNPRTGKEYYWEHFGRMDDPDYAGEACAKINFYAKHGILPGDRLIVSFETAHSVLDPEAVEMLIKKYLQ